MSHIAILAPVCKLQFFERFMARLMALFLLLVFALQVSAAEPCRLAFAPRASFADLGREFESFGLKTLNEALNDPALEVRVESKRWPWQKDIDFDYSFTGRKRLLVRKTHFATEVEHQRLLWRLAEALYKSKVQLPLFSRAAWLSEQPYTGPIDSDAALEYLAVTMPQEWRAERLQRLNALAEEMRTLFTRLPQLDAKPRIRDANSRALLFSYYFGHLRRIARVTLVLEVLALAPTLPELPQDVHNMVMQFQAQQQLSAQTQAQIKRLEGEIRALKRAHADPASIAEIERHLQLLLEPN